jgi:hypothetical protein
VQLAKYNTHMQEKGGCEKHTGKKNNKNSLGLRLGMGKVHGFGMG